MIVFSKTVKWVVLWVCGCFICPHDSSAQISLSDPQDSTEIPVDPTRLVSFLSKRAVLEQRDEDFIFRGVRVVYRKKKRWKVKRNRCVRISEGKVSKMRHRWLWMPRRGAIRIRDVKRKYLAPGLFDMHIHYDCDNFTRLALLRYGVTTVRNFDHHILRDREQELITSRNLVSPDIYFGYPHRYEHSGRYNYIAKEGADFLVHRFFHWPDNKKPLEIARNDGLDVAMEAWPGNKIHPLIEDKLVRTVEGMNAIISPDWPKGDPDLELINLLKDQDGIWSVPCAAASSGPWDLGGVINAYFRNYHGEVPVSIVDNWAEIVLSDKGDKRLLPGIMKRYHSDRIWILTRMIKEGVPLLIGSEAGSGMPLIYPGFSVHEEMQLFRDLGMKEGDVLDAATVEAAKCLRLDDWVGRVAKGYRADMVVLEENPLTDIGNYQSIGAVMANGFWLGPRELDWIKASLGESGPFEGRKLK